jgi:Signal peptidase, peptidase S26
MKCPACSFENIPGLERCVRCRGALNLAAIDFEPPRASGSVVLRHSRHRVGGAFGGLAYRIGRVWGSLRLPGHLFGTPAGALALSIIPGMGQIVSRQRRLGGMLLGGWCVLMILSLLGYGTQAGGWCRAGAIILHATAIALVMRPAISRLGWAARLMLGILIVVVLQLTLYRSVTWMTDGFAGVLPVQQVHDTASVRNGDAVLYTGRWVRPDRFDRGDLVVYTLERGYGVDRVIGFEGEHVAVVSGRVLIDGKPLPAGIAPLNGAGHFPDFEFDVAPGHLAILPSALQWYANGQDRQRLLVQMLRRNSRVTESSVLGRAFWRLRPLKRFGAME